MAGWETRSRRDLYASIAVAALAVSFALVGLAGDENWPKVVRVALSFLAYVGTLGLWLRFGSRGGGRVILPFPAFTSAGAAAGVVSGIVRPHVHPGILLVGSLAGAFLLGGVHWLALAYWRSLRLSIGRRSVAGPPG